MPVEEFDSLILYVSSLPKAKHFYHKLLGLSLVFEDEIVAVVRTRNLQIVLHRNDRGHDERGVFPTGPNVGGAALRFNITDPDTWEVDLRQKGMQILWPSQEASWGRFLVVSDPDGRPVVLAKMSVS